MVLNAHRKGLLGTGRRSGRGCGGEVSKVNMVLNVHRNHKRMEEGGMEVWEEGEYIPIATLSPPE